MTVTQPIPRLEKRSALIDATLAEIRLHGPINVHPSEICEDLGLSKALVNYHFGGRDGLVAEAMEHGYSLYVDGLQEAAEAAGDDPVERLFAWFEAQVRWTIANPGLAAALNFPTEAGGMTEDTSAAIAARMAEHGARNFANLTALVAAARVHLSGTDPDDMVEMALDAGVVGWLCLGSSVWFSGHHLPTRDMGLSQYLDQSLAHMRTVIVAMLSRPTG
jgi:AcrR family transcriptional regulator